jgi:selenocysteine lyase/cysteine desulfurase
MRLLTSDHEFTSFARQTRRLEETGRLVVARIAAQPYATFAERFREALASGFDLVFLSHVFFDTGFHVVDLDAALAGVPERTLVAVDGYHAVGAVPVDLSRLAGRIFYLGGGYKYLQAGEGACFMAVPPAGDALRPAFTGWFAEPGADARMPPAAAEVAYGSAAARFWGATFDPSGLYRLNAVMRLYSARGVDASAIHTHAAHLMDRFLAGIATARLDRLPADSLVPPQGVPRGNFLAFGPSAPAETEERLLARGVLVDRRGASVRFGFGVYQDDAFIDRLVERVADALADPGHASPRPSLVS